MKKVLIVIGLIVVIGAVMLGIFKFNIGLDYSKSQYIQIYIGEEFDIVTANKVVKDAMKGNYLLNKADAYGHTLVINAKEISEETKTIIITAINEKYGLENNSEDIMVYNNPNMRLRDLAKPYVMPFIIAVLIVLVYTGIRFKKIKPVLVMFISLILGEILLLSIYSITRIEINRATIPLGMIVFMVITLYMTKKIENKNI